MALAGVSYAQVQQPLWDISFIDSQCLVTANGVSETVTKDGVNLTSTSLKIELLGDTQINNGTCETTANQRVYITDLSPDITMTDDFSIVIQGSADTAPANWGVLFGFGNSYNNNIKIANNDSGKLTFLEESVTLSDKNSYLSTEYATPGTYIITADAQEGNKSLLSLYYNGKLASTAILDTSNYNGDLAVFSVGGRIHTNGNSTDFSFTNVQLYSGVLDASAIASLSVPEPATATLSLLALCGLAARRRRK